MDKSTWIGLLLAVAGLLFGFILDGGSISGLIMISAALIVFGGTFGAVIAGTPMRVLKNVPYILKIAFKKKKEEFHNDIDDLVELAKLSRRDGILALENENEKYEDDRFLKREFRWSLTGKKRSPFAIFCTEK